MTGILGTMCSLIEKRPVFDEELLLAAGPGSLQASLTTLGKSLRSSEPVL